MRCVLPENDPILQTDTVHDAAAVIGGGEGGNWVGAEVPVSEFCLYECKPEQSTWPSIEERAGMDWKPAGCVAISTLRVAELAAGQNGALESDIDLCRGEE